MEAERDILFQLEELRKDDSLLYCCREILCHLRRLLRDKEHSERVIQWCNQVAETYVSSGLYLWAHTVRFIPIQEFDDSPEDDLLATFIARILWRGTEEPSDVIEAKDIKNG